MLFIDDLLLAPLHGLMWVFREIDDIAEKELAGEGAEVTRELSELYLRLDSGAISEDEFTAEESRLLDRLDAIETRDGPEEDEEGDDEDPEEDPEEDDEDDAHATIE
jgi:hypothetical protein